MVNRDLRKVRSERIVVNLDRLIASKSRATGRKLSLRQIEKATGIGASTLLHWKNGDVTRFDADNLVALCDYFECSLGRLLKLLPPE